MVAVFAKREVVKCLVRSAIGAFGSGRGYRFHPTHSISFNTEMWKLIVILFTLRTQITVIVHGYRNRGETHEWDDGDQNAGTKTVVRIAGKFEQTLGVTHWHTLFLKSTL